MKESELKLVESFDELEVGQRVLIKDCRCCKKDCIEFIMSVNKISFFGNVYVSGTMHSFEQSAIVYKPPYTPYGINCIIEKRLFRFIDFDKNSSEEQEITRTTKRQELIVREFEASRK